MSSKPQVITGYSIPQTDLAERVLLEVWSRLGDFHDHLVLIGGLVPRYLVPQDQSPNASIPPHCGTMDVDLAVSLAIADLDAYIGMRETLTESMGFEPGPLFGEILGAVEDAQLDGEISTREEAAALVVKHWGNQSSKS